MSGSYDAALVWLSLLVATLASFTALDLAARVTHTQGRAAAGWLVAGAIAMGAGIWSMHFIGMLAFDLPVAIAYDFKLTAASMGIAIVISGIALSVASRERLGLPSLIGGGLFMGIGICAMHYTGMAAMQMLPSIQYDPWLFAASVVIAIGASLAALWLAFTLRGSTRWLKSERLLAALAMGIAITGMHYTGMAAAHFAPNAICTASGPLALRGASLAFATGAVVICLLLLTLAASMLDARLSRRRAEMVTELQRKNDELKAEIAARVKAEDGLTASLAEQRRLAQALTQRTCDLERSNKELEQFAYVASHDLQAPLRSVGGFVQLLEKKAAGWLDAETKEYLHFIVDATRQMQDLIRALLELGRLGQNGLSLADTDLNQALGAARNALTATIAERGARIEVENLPVVHADCQLLTQLLQNLLSNAIKFQPGAPPIVHVSARQQEQQWVISVADNGIGIDKQYHARIFRIFQRLHTSEQFDGSGIGLAICEKIVHLHGGTIWLDSQPGAGSTFSFSLPLRQGAAIPRAG